MATIILNDSGLPELAQHGDGCAVDSEDKSNGGAVSSGTTIVACRFNGGIVMAADTRTSAGSYVVNRAARKISRLHDRIFVCRSGSAADTQTLAQIARNYLQQHAQELPPSWGLRPCVLTAAKLLQRMAYDYKDQLTAGLIIAGWDAMEGGQIYSIPLGGACLKMSYAAGGSGSGYISAYMDDNYKDNMTKDEAINFLKKSVAYAISRDGSSGGMVRVIVCTKDSVEEDLVLGDQLPVQP